MGESRYEIRQARRSDIPALITMQAHSMRVFGARHYEPALILEFLERFGTLDDALVHEGHYLVAEDRGGRILGSGGWSRLPPPWGDIGAGEDTASVRSVFVDPGAARQGIASAIVRRSEADAAGHAIATLRVTAPLSGVQLYRSLGYRMLSATGIALGNGSRLGCIEMEKRLAPAQAAWAA